MSEIEAENLSAEEQEAEETETPETEETLETPAAAAETPTVEVVRGQREFHIGSAVVKENDSTAGLTNEQAMGVLKHAYPEIANATIRTSSKNGVDVVEFLPQAGRKG